MFSMGTFKERPMVGYEKMYTKLKIQHEFEKTHTQSYKFDLYFQTMLNIALI